MRLTRAVLVAASLSAIAACQTAGPGASYHFFFSPADHVSQLLAQGEVDKANQIWSQQAAFFVANTNSDAVKASRSLADALSDRLAPRLERERLRLDAIVWPVPRVQWSEVKAGLMLAEAMQAELDEFRVLSAAGDVRRDRFRQALDRKAASIRSDAPTHFRAEDPAFFETYPVPLDRRAVLAAARESWVAALEAAPHADVRSFLGRYQDALDDTGLRELARLYFRAAWRGDGGGANRIHAALEETRLSGLPIERLDRAGVRVVELANRGAVVAFPIRAAGTPFSVDVVALDRLVDDAATDAADVVVVVDARAASAERTIVSREGVQSEYGSGTRERRNPDYERARENVADARVRLREVRRAFERQLDRCRVDCSNPALLRHSGLPEAEFDYEAALNILAMTPKTIAVPTYSAYRFDKLTVDVGKAGSLAYYVLDRRARTLRKGIESVSVRERFVVAEGLHEADRDRSRFAGMHAEFDILSYAQRTESVSIAPIFERLTALAVRPLPAMAEIRNEIIADRTAMSVSGQGRAAAGLRP